MRILLTGGTGFLGTYISETLRKNHEVFTLGRSELNTIRADLSKEIPDLPTVDWVIHAASPAHFIPKTDAEKQSFFDINEEGTKRLLVRLNVAPKVFIYISTVAVYGLDEGEMISESTSLNPNTAYGKSKLRAENHILDWFEEKETKVFILRLPLVVGINPPGNLSAIAKAIQKKIYFRVGKGGNKKSMVLAEDVAELLEQLSEKKPGIYHICDPNSASLAEIDEAIASHYNYKIKEIPEFAIKVAAKVGDLLPFFPINNLKVKKLSSTLTFRSDKAKAELGWNPKSVLEFLKNTPIIS